MKTLVDTHQIWKKYRNSYLGKLGSIQSSHQNIFTLIDNSFHGVSIKYYSKDSLKSNLHRTEKG